MISKSALVAMLTAGGTVLSASVQADQFSMRAVDIPYSKASTGSDFVRFDANADGRMDTFEFGHERPLIAIQRMDGSELTRAVMTGLRWPERPRLTPMYGDPGKLICVGERSPTSTSEKGLEILAGQIAAPIHRQILLSNNTMSFAAGHASGNPSLPYALFTGGAFDLRSHSNDPFNPLWQDGSTSTHGLALAQVDADPEPELLVARAGLLEVRNSSNGTVEDSFVTDASYTSTVMVGNIDGDAQLEVVTSGSQGLRAFDIAPLRSKWQRADLAIGEIEMVDRDGDGKSEFLAELEQGYDRVAWLDSNGIVSQSIESEDAFIESLGLVDLDSDNSPEVIEISVRNYRVHASDLSSTLLERPLVTGPFTRFEVADLDRDGRDELVSLTSDPDYPDPSIPNVRVVDASSGRQLWTSRFDVDNQEGGLAIGQLDVDPALEIVLTGAWGFNPESDGVIIVDGLTRAEQQRIPLDVPAGRRISEIAVLPADATHPGTRLVAALAPANSETNGIRLAEYDTSTWARSWLSPAVSGHYQLDSLVAMQADDDGAIEVVVNTAFWGSYVFDSDSHLLQSSFSPGSSDSVALPGGRIAYALADSDTFNVDPAVVVVDSRSGQELQRVPLADGLTAIASVPGNPDRLIVMTSERLQSISLAAGAVVGESHSAGSLNGYKSNGRLLTRMEPAGASFLFGNEVGIWETTLLQREEPQFADGFELMFE